MHFLRRFLALISALFLLCSSALGESTPSDAEGAATGTDITTDWVLPPYIIDATRMPDAEWPFEEDAELLEIWLPQIADADCALIRCGGKNILIDAAAERHGKRVMTLLKDTGVDRLDYILNTHPHNDHLMGLLTIAEEVQVDALGICFHEYYTDWMRKALLKCYSKDIPIFHYDDGDVFTLGNATLEVALKVPTSWKLNDKSAVMRLSMGERSMLFTADIENKAQLYLSGLLQEEFLDADILKFPHHGLAPLNEDFFMAVSPDYCLITNTNRNYKTTYELRRSLVPYLFSVSGHIHLATDGQIWFIELVPPSAPVDVEELGADIEQEE